MTNARSPDTSCFGYIILSSVGDAKKCISSLHKTELNKSTISVTFDKVRKSSLHKTELNNSTISITFDKVGKRGKEVKSDFE